VDLPEAQIEQRVPVGPKQEIIGNLVTTSIFEAHYMGCFEYVGLSAAGDGTLPTVSGQQVSSKWCLASTLDDRSTDAFGLCRRGEPGGNLFYLEFVLQFVVARRARAGRDR
jgi:hypothetical protein